MTTQCNKPAIESSSRPRCSGGVQAYAEPDGGTPSGVVVSGDDLYSIDTAHGDVVTCKRAECGKSRKVIGNSPTPTTVLPTACAVLWGDTNGTIYRVAR